MGVVPDPCYAWAAVSCGPAAGKVHVQHVGLSLCKLAPDHASKGNAKKRDEFPCAFHFKVVAPKSYAPWECSDLSPIQANVHHMRQPVQHLCHSSCCHEPQGLRGFLASCRAAASLLQVGPHHVRLHRTHVLCPVQPAQMLCKLCHGLC